MILVKKKIIELSFKFGHNLEKSVKKDPKLGKPLMVGKPVIS